MRHRFLVPALALSALLTSVLVGTAASPAQAVVVNTPVVGVTITPATVGLGTSARVVVTATKVGAKGMGRHPGCRGDPLGAVTDPAGWRMIRTWSGPTTAVDETDQPARS
jgi:hypothetical protein